MTPNQLRKAGTELFGDNWQTPLAAALEVNPRTVRRYFAGDQPIPLVVFLAVVCLLAESRGMLKRSDG